MAVKKLRKFPGSRVWIFKIKNRRGYAAVCLNHLTEGGSPSVAFARMAKVLKRLGLALSGSVPKAR